MLISLTDDGTALHERARAIPGVVGASIGLDRVEIDQLRTTLRKLAGNIAKAGHPPPLPE